MDDVIDASISHALFDIRKRFNALVEPHRSDLWRFCLYLTGSPWDAEDLAQETLLKAFGRLSTVFQPLEVKPYLFRIASNTWIDTMRRARPADDLPDELATVDASADPDPIATHAAIERMVAVLPPRQRVVCLLIDVFDVSLAHAALMLDTTVGAVKALLHRARATLHTSASHDTPDHAAVLVEPPDDALVRSYLDAFNRRDLDALVALLHPDATSDILGVFIEHGRDAIKAGSLASWASDARPQHAKYGTLDGRPTFFVFLTAPSGGDALAWLVTLDVAGGQIVHIHDYYFCADLVRFTAAALGIPSLPNEPFVS